VDNIYAGSVELAKKRFSLQTPESNKAFEKPLRKTGEHLKAYYVLVLCHAIIIDFRTNFAGNIENLKKRFSQSQDDFKNIGGQSNKGGLVETLRKRFAQSQTNAPDMSMVVKTGNYQICTFDNNKSQA